MASEGTKTKPATEGGETPAPRSRGVRIVFLLYYWLAFPVFLFCLAMFWMVITVAFDPRRGEMPDEDARVIPDLGHIVVLVPLLLFAAGYLIGWRAAPEFKNARRTWLPFAAQILVLALSFCWVIAYGPEATPLLYIGMLLTLLIVGARMAITSARQKPVS